MQVKAKLNNIRIAPRKIRLVTNFIKNMDIETAVNQLDATVKKGSAPIKKLLLSAVANGENDFGIDRNNMYVKTVIVGAGPTLKRWMPKAFGRAGQIMKRTSKIELVIEERVEGKGRKTKEQLEKEKQARADAKKKAEKKREQEVQEADEKPVEENVTKNVDKVKKTGKDKQATENQGSWGSKIFRRKSM
jgi:large subunit ribosomal protein L22